VINNDYRRAIPKDTAEATVAATDYYVEEIGNLLADGLDPVVEAFDTPEYEGPLGVDTFETGPGNSGFKGCANCTLPEPYPFRTTLPKIDMPRCPQLPYAVFVPATVEDAAIAISMIKHYEETFTILSGGHDYGKLSSLDSEIILNVM